MYKIDYENLLNPAQLEAVTMLDGPVLVIAGAGSGKTRTLVYRVARLVESGIDPQSILLLTFTRKAAEEMLHRASNLSDERCTIVSGGTFHSLGHRVLRNNAELMGFDRSFTILDRSDMEEVIQSLVKEMDINKGATRFPKKATLASILSKAANLQQPLDILMREEYAQFLEHIPMIITISQHYEDFKKHHQLMDYDDLLIHFRRLIVENEGLRSALSRQYQYIMVDEYQDTNLIQADILKALSSGHGNIMVVGDDSQSIYSFRGANYRNMFDFPGAFPNTRIIKLEENYRSTQPILTFTNALMSQTAEKYTKCLFTKREDGDLPQVINVKTSPEQALFISRTIAGFLNMGKSLKDMAVLFRAAYHSFDLELELTRQGIPFVKYGGFKFMESAHIKDLLAHLKVLVNRNDTVSWGRILRLIKNIGQRKSQLIIKWLREENIDPWAIHEWPGAGKKDNGLKPLSALFRDLSRKNIKPREAVELVYHYYNPFLMERFDDYPRRQKDLEQLEKMAGRKRKLRSFIDELMLDPPTSNADIEQNERDDFLTLSTVHSAKGLEWSIVFVIWVMEGYFPSIKSYSSDEAMEEERRLMYVAATRSKDTLILSYPGREELPMWQSAQMGFRNGLSYFIQGLPDHVMEHVLPTGYKVPYRIQTQVNRKPERPDSDFSFKDEPQELKKGDRVRHPAFGMGVIFRFLDKEKVEVLFRDAGKKLLHLEYTTLEKV